jgi:tryptophan-rich sensory protein
MRISTVVSTAAGVVAAAVVGGAASRQRGSRAGESLWYAQLRKPNYQPPRQVFPVVWPALYADITAVSVSTIDQLRDTARREELRAYVVALGVNLMLNVSWTWLFFNRHELAASAAVAAALTGSSADLTRRAVRAGGSRGAPLALYPMWCAFATALPTHIWLLNRGTTGQGLPKPVSMG